uniref:Zinc-ribbon domain-containing protein n=1 Tax=Dulem virus 39 TaxID=3145757 RepID=A0AAU8B5B5_9CAUD
MAIIKCHECGGEMSDEADFCPNCGAKLKKKDANNKFIDDLCLLSLVAATFLILLGKWYIGYIITLFWLIVYQAMYEKKRKDYTVDCSGIKKTRLTILIFFILQFGFTIIFIFC